MSALPLRAAGVLAAAALSAPAAFADGDVLVTIDKSNALRLVGDDLANDVQVDRDAVTREFVVRGRNGTTVNGAEVVRVPDAPAISAELRGGDDTLAVGGFRLRRTFTADLGDGNDLVTFLRVAVRGRTVLRGGTGDDTVRLEGGCDLRGRLDVATSEGADLVRVADGVLRGPVRIVTGNGSDRVEVHRNGLTEAASLRVETGADDDAVDLLGNTVQAGGRIVTSDGADRVTVATTRFRRDLFVNAGTGDDDVNVDRATFDERLLVQGGEGTNRVFIGAAVVTSGGLTAGAVGHSGNFYWWFVIVHVY